jgi:hypothetical protein
MGSSPIWSTVFAPRLTECRMFLYLTVTLKQRQLERAVATSVVFLNDGEHPLPFGYVLNHLACVQSVRIEN